MILIVLAISVLTFGAIPGDHLDDRPGIQAAVTTALATGDVVEMPPGDYEVSRAGTAYECLLFPGVQVTGAGATIHQMVVGRSVRLIRVTGRGNVFTDLTLDGNRALQTVDEQRHGLFADGVDGLVLRRVTARNFTGDGFYLRTARDSTLDGIVAEGNGRNGVTLGGAVTGTRGNGMRLVGNAAQQFDSEPGGTDVVADTWITGSVLDGAGVSGDFALTISGTGIDTPAHDWVVMDNLIGGGVFMVHAHAILLVHNTVRNPTVKSVEANRSASLIRIVDNVVEATQISTAGIAAIAIVGTAGSGPSDVTVERNHVRVADPRGFGIAARGAVSIVIRRNELEGAGSFAPQAAGIYLRATVPDRPFESAVVEGNVIRRFGDRGISVAGNGAARLLRLVAIGNDISETPVGFSLDDGSGALVAASIMDSVFGAGVLRKIINQPAGATLLISPTP